MEEGKKRNINLTKRRLNHVVKIWCRFSKISFRIRPFNCFGISVHPNVSVDGPMIGNHWEKLSQSKQCHCSVWLSWSIYFFPKISFFISVGKDEEVTDEMFSSYCFLLKIKSVFVGILKIYSRCIWMYVIEMTWNTERIHHPLKLWGNFELYRTLDVYSRKSSF